MRGRNRGSVWSVSPLIVALAVVAAACGGGAGSEEPESLVFAAVPSEEASRLEESYRVTLEILEAELGVDIEFFQAADYAGVIEGQIAGTVDIAQYGPFSYVIATNNGAAIEPAGAMTGAPDEEPGYQSYGIAPADSEINSLEDFRGKTVCFVDPSSTSGFLYPSAGLLELGISPETDVTPVFAGGHDASGISVANGDCDAGFAFDSMVDIVLIENGDVAPGELKVVWKSEVIAGSPVAVSTELPDDLRSLIKSTFIDKVNVDWAVANGYCPSADECSLSDEEIWGYKAVDNSFYDGVRKVCEVTEAPACTS
jgi:phosphonate transport system substrate-binding protein